MNRIFSLAAALLAAASLASCANFGRDSGWQTLIDGSKGMENWDTQGGANWRAEDGAIVADRRTDTTGQHYLVTKRPYKDFQLRVEFWASPDANSGIYMRCSSARPMTDRTCYEANIFDQRPDPTYGTGSIVHWSPINPMPKAGGKWNTYDITVKGSQIVVVLNGVQTANISTDGKLAEGPIALQYAGGTMKFRKFQIRPI
jgi:hypothetical protein